MRDICDSSIQGSDSSLRTRDDGIGLPGPFNMTDGRFGFSIEKTGAVVQDVARQVRDLNADLVELNAQLSAMTRKTMSGLVGSLQLP